VAMSEMVFKKFRINNTRHNNHLLAESFPALCGRAFNQIRICSLVIDDPSKCNFQSEFNDPRSYQK